MKMHLANECLEVETKREQKNVDYTLHTDKIDWIPMYIVRVGARYAKHKWNNLIDMSHKQKCKTVYASLHMNM